MTPDSLTVGPLLAQPVGHVETIEQVVEGTPLTITITTMPDWLDVHIQGTNELTEICARCGREFPSQVELNGTYRAEYEPSEDDIFKIDARGNLPIVDLLHEEQELKRSDLPHCPECQDAPKPIIIE